MDLTVILLIFGAGLMLFRQTVVRVTAVLALTLGILVARNDFGSLVHNLADGAWHLVTGA